MLGRGSAGNDTSFLGIHLLLEFIALVSCRLDQMVFFLFTPQIDVSDNTTLATLHNSLIKTLELIV